MDKDLFEQPCDAVGAFSKAQDFGKFQCYRHLQGDNMYVAYDCTTGRREFFGSAEELQLWVELHSLNLRRWRPALHRG